MSPEEFTKRRKRLRLTAAELGELTGYHERSIYAFELGEVTISNRMRAVLDALEAGHRPPPIECGADLRAARRRLGLSQGDFAAALGYRREYLGRLERDAVALHPGTAIRLAFQLALLEQKNPAGSVDGLLSGGAEGGDLRNVSERRSGRVGSSPAAGAGVGLIQVSDGR